MSANCSNTKNLSQNWNTKSTNYSEKIIMSLPLCRGKLIMISEVHHLVILQIQVQFMMGNCHRFIIIPTKTVIVIKIVQGVVRCTNLNPSSITYSKSPSITTKTPPKKLQETARINYLGIKNKISKKSQLDLRNKMLEMACHIIVAAIANV